MISCINGSMYIWYKKRDSATRKRKWVVVSTLQNLSLRKDVSDDYNIVAHKGTVYVMVNFLSPRGVLKKEGFLSYLGLLSRVTRLTSY